MNLDNRPKIIGVLLVAAILIMSVIFVAVSMGDDEDEDENVEYIKIQDAMGNTIKMEDSPETIVSGAPSITESIYSMGLEDKLIASTGYTTYPQEAMDRMSLPESDEDHLANIGSYWEPSVEAITNLSADVIFLTETGGSVDTYESLKEIEENVVMLHQEVGAADIYKNYWLMLNVLMPPSSDQNVEDIIDSAAALYGMKEAIDAVEEEMSTGTMDKRVLMHLGWWGDLDEDVWVAGKNTFIHESADKANVTNIADIDGFGQMSKEIFIDDDTNPDIIISVGGGYDNWTYLMDNLTENKVWNSTDAVKNEQVFLFTDRAEEITSRASPEAYADLVKLMAMVLQPDAFANFEPPKLIGDDYADLFDGHW